MSVLLGENDWLDLDGGVNQRNLCENDEINGDTPVANPLPFVLLHFLLLGMCDEPLGGTLNSRHQSYIRVVCSAIIFRHF